MLSAETNKEANGMNPAKRILAVLLCAALLISVLCACGKTAGTGADTDTNDDSVAQQLYDTDVAAPDLTNATEITLSGADDVTITDGGVYVLTGTLTDGRVLVNAPGADVTLVLQNADITCTDSSALYIYKAANVLVYLPDGTTSTLTDGSSYDDSDSFSSTTDEEPNACLYAKSGLIIAGGGTLTVTGNANNGITGKDTLKIEGTAVNVTAANHGINGKDCLVLKQANVTVTSGGDALRATNDSDSALGCILIGASVLTLTAGEDGIQAETTLTLFDTTGTITSGGGSSAALAGDTSAKGIKAGTDITIRSGSYTLDCADDGVHANGNVTVSGGTFAITTGDDGVHADDTVTITDGTAGRAIVSGSVPYEITFTYADGSVSALTCGCYETGLCKHGAAMLLQLRETLEKIHEHWPDALAEDGYFAAVSKSAFSFFTTSSSKPASITLT